MSKTVLIIGATRGLGASLVKHYASTPSTSTIYATTRSTSPPSAPPADSTKIKWLFNIDAAKPSVGQDLVQQLSKGEKPTLNTVILTAGYFGLESFDEPDWEKQVRMYTTSAIGPVFIVQALVKSSLLGSGSKVVLVSSESGSITLRHESEGGGNYGHHASKAAENMVGKLLSFDLKDQNIVVGMVHPGFMRTEMTKSVGFDQYWDQGGG
jgi:NAD(P)-dependent dehydrogenase (short-subunit alcohol dehydrogenase family)